MTAMPTAFAMERQAAQGFDMAAFSRGDYVRALEAQRRPAETISKVLYPADDHIQGKRLRLKQQYLPSPPRCRAS